MEGDSKGLGGVFEKGTLKPIKGWLGKNEEWSVRLRPTPMIFSNYTTTLSLKNYGP